LEVDCGGEATYGGEEGASLSGEEEEVPEATDRGDTTSAISGPNNGVRSGVAASEGARDGVESTAVACSWDEEGVVGLEGVAVVDAEGVVEAEER
jgi:hypothetical protein